MNENNKDAQHEEIGMTASPIVDSLVLLNQQSEEITTFNRIDSCSLDGWTEFSATEENNFMPLFSSIANSMPLLGTHWANGTLFKATVNPSKLVQSKGGFLTVIRGENGQFKGSAPFQKANTFAVLSAMQVASFVTGQYYMHQINEKLEIISQQLGNIESHLYDSDEGELRTAYNILFTLAKRENFSVVDKNDFSIAKAKINDKFSQYMQSFRASIDSKYSNKQGKRTYLPDWQKKLFQNRRIKYIEQQFTENNHHRKQNIFLMSAYLRLICSQISIKINSSFTLEEMSLELKAIEDSLREFNRKNSEFCNDSIDLLKYDRCDKSELAINKIEKLNTESSDKTASIFSNLQAIQNKLLSDKFEVLIRTEENKQLLYYREIVE